MIEGITATGLHPESLNNLFIKDLQSHPLIPCHSSSRNLEGCRSCTKYPRQLLPEKDLFNSSTTSVVKIQMPLQPFLLVSMGNETFDLPSSLHLLDALFDPLRFIIFDRSFPLFL